MADKRPLVDRRLPVMDDKDHLALMRSFGQLEEGQRNLGHRVTDFEKRMFDEFKRLREDFRAALDDAVKEMRHAHDQRDVDAKAVEKRVDSLERDGSHHDGAWAVGSRALSVVGLVLLTLLNAVITWWNAHGGK